MVPGTPAERATDASVEGEHVRGTVSPLEDWRTVVAQRAVFQSLASMGLPAFTIHSIVILGTGLEGCQECEDTDVWAHRSKF